MNKNNIFYIRLIELINKSSKSVNQVERELGYPRNALHNYKGGMDPSGERLLELAHYFDVTPDYLMGREDNNLGVSTKDLFSRLEDNQKVEIFLLCQKWLISKIDLSD